MKRRSFLTGSAAWRRRASDAAFDVWEASFNSRVGRWVGALEGSQYRPNLQTDRFIEFFHQHKASDPPFMMVQGYYLPHDPFSAPKRFYEPYWGKRSVRRILRGDQRAGRECGAHHGCA
jgi:hypothetical protein